LFFGLKNAGLKLDAMKKELKLVDHKLSLDQLCKKYHCNSKGGITHAQANINFERDGPNLLFPELDSEVSKIMMSAGDPDPDPDPNHDDRLRFVLLWRGGEKVVGKVECLTVGDIVEVKSGDRIPADLLILESRDFKVNNCNLTGESEPQSRSSEFTHEDPLETKNLAFFLTNVVEGFAKGMVINTGGRTLMGRLAGVHIEEMSFSPVLTLLDELDTDLEHLISSHCFLEQAETFLR